MMLHKAFLLVLFLMQVLVPAHAGRHSASPGHKVVFQVTDNSPQKWYLTLSNAKNVQEELGMKNVQIEVVVYGPGLDMVLLETQIAEKIDEAVSRGVKIVACENTMAGRKLTREDMYPSVGYVKAAVVELMKRQRQGWAYVQP